MGDKQRVWRSHDTPLLGGTVQQDGMYSPVGAECLDASGQSGKIATQGIAQGIARQTGQRLCLSCLAHQPAQAARGTPGFGAINGFELFFLQFAMRLQSI